MPPHVEADVVISTFHMPCSLDLAGRGLSKREREYVATNWRATHAMDFGGPGAGCKFSGDRIAFQQGNDGVSDVRSFSPEALAAVASDRRQAPAVSASDR